MGTIKITEYRDLQMIQVNNDLSEAPWAIVIDLMREGDNVYRYLWALDEVQKQFPDASGAFKHAMLRVALELKDRRSNTKHVEVFNVCNCLHVGETDQRRVLDEVSDEVGVQWEWKLRTDGSTEPQR